MSQVQLPQAQMDIKESNNPTRLKIYTNGVLLDPEVVLSINSWKSSVRWIPMNDESKLASYKVSLWRVWTFTQVERILGSEVVLKINVWKAQFDELPTLKLASYKVLGLSNKVLY